ncbi:MAG TPA: ABC transporter permease subunit [Mycobacteriales bacterium]|nr:ABC transporter permease subunit [Mycobacteriales bacterium]
MGPGRMGNVIRAELLKLRRRSVVVAVAGVVPLLAVISTVVLFANAGSGSPDTGPQAEFNPTLGQLGESGGMTRGFVAAASFLGLLVLITFVASVANEWGQGTLRALLVREPRRLRLLAGKAVALLLVTAIAFVLALVAGSVAAYVMAAVRDVPTGAWLGAGGWRTTGGDWLRSVLSVGCYGLIGLALGSLVRSTTVGIAIAFAWFFPFEHILQNNWAGAGRWFPGLLFEAVATDGNDVTSFGRALALGAVVVAVIVAVACVDLRRRDVNA